LASPVIVNMPEARKLLGRSPIQSIARHDWEQAYSEAVDSARRRMLDIAMSALIDVARVNS
jgi:hypothetical protein